MDRRQPLRDPRGENAAKSKRPHRANHKTHKNHAGTLFHHHLEDVSCLCADRHPDTDFPNATSDRPCEQAVDTDRGKRDCNPCELKRKDHRRTLRSERATNTHVHRQHVVERESGINPLDGGSCRGC